MTRYEIIGPYIFEIEMWLSTATRESYDILLFRDWEIIRKTRYSSRMVLPLPHNVDSVIQYLSRKFPNGQIGKDGSMSWPTHSPNLSPCDYFLWGYLKDILYRNSQSSLEELNSNSTDAVHSIDTSILEKVLRNRKHSYLRSWRKWR